MGCGSSSSKEAGQDIVVKSPAQKDWEENEELIRKATIKRKKTEAKEAERQGSTKKSTPPQKLKSKKSSTHLSSEKLSEGEAPRRQSSEAEHPVIDLIDNDEAGGDRL